MMSTRSNIVRQNDLADLLFETSPAAIIQTDLLGKVERVNRAALDWFGYQESELINEPAGALFAHSSVRVAESFWSGVTSQVRHLGTSEQAECLGLHKDGSTFLLRITWYLFSTPQVSLVIGSMLNLSEAHRGTEKRIAGERVTAIMEMVTGLAHKNRNAMQRAQACLDLLELDLTNQPELMQLADQIRTALSDLSRNYEDVKEYASQITLNRFCVDIGELCQDTFDEILPSYRDAAPKLRISCAKDCQCATIDPGYMRQVFRHLFENSFQASSRKARSKQDDSERVWIECDFTRDSERSDFVQISIRDHGDGLSDDVAQRMFEPFFTTKQHGTGLGLAVARRIVEAHGGTIDASNHPGGGTVVRIRLPKTS